MSDCRKIREGLAESFDSGEALSTTQTTHIAECDGCRAYHAELRALESDLIAMPLAVAPAGLSDRIEGRIVQYRQERRWYGVLVGAAVCVLLVGLVGLSWWYPVEAYWPEWLDAANALFEGDVLFVADDQLMSEATLLWSSAVSRLNGINQFSDWMLYTGIAGVLMFFFCFNGVEAWSLRNFYRLKERH